MTRLSTLLDEIDSGAVLLPEFQRGYVWNRDQVRGLMRSLYRGYPVGGLLMWETTSEDITVAGPQRVAVHGSCCSTGSSESRRCTASSAARLRRSSKATRAAFTGLHFNVETESFEFYAPTKMAGDPHG